MYLGARPENSQAGINVGRCSGRIKFFRQKYDSGPCQRRARSQKCSHVGVGPGRHQKIFREIMPSQRRVMLLEIQLGLASWHSRARQIEIQLCTMPEKSQAGRNVAWRHARVDLDMQTCIQAPYQRRARQEEWRHARIRAVMHKWSQVTCHKVKPLGVS